MDARPIVALVAGATRGGGRGIACALGEIGAIVYCTGRSSRVNRVPRTGGQHSVFDLRSRPETIEETAALVDKHGGSGIALRVDHTAQDQVKELIERIRAEHGRLDLLVNDIWGGDELTEWGKPFWELSLTSGLSMLERAVHSHIITARYAIPLMLEQKRGLIVEVTDGATSSYRENFFYDLVKISVIRIAFALSEELREYNISAVAITPGFLRSEAILEHLGVSEANWKEGAKKDPHFVASETPLYLGRAVASMSRDPRVSTKSGKVVTSWDLATEYGFTDIDGQQPNWGAYYEKNIAKDR